MFLVRLKTIGNCVIPDLDDFIIYSDASNNKIIDLEEYFPLQKIKKSLKAPNGSLYNLMSQKIIQQVNPNSSEYKQIQFNNEREKIKTNKKTITEIVKELKILKISDCIEELERIYFDNIGVLQRIIDEKNSFSSRVVSTAKKIMNNLLNEEIDKKFIIL